jgi:hypothetical protein
MYKTLAVLVLLVGCGDTIYINEGDEMVDETPDQVAPVVQADAGVVGADAGQPLVATFGTGRLAVTPDAGIPAVVEVVAEPVPAPIPAPVEPEEPKAVLASVSFEKTPQFRVATQHQVVAELVGEVTFEPADAGFEAFADVSLVVTLPNNEQCMVAPYEIPTFSCNGPQACPPITVAADGLALAVSRFYAIGASVNGRPGAEIQYGNVLTCTYRVETTAKEGV